MCISVRNRLSSSKGKGRLIGSITRAHRIGSWLEDEVWQMWTRTKNVPKARQQDPPQGSPHGNSWISHHLCPLQWILKLIPPVFESLSLASQSWERVTCVPYSSEWKERRSGLLDTLVVAVHSSQPSGKPKGRPSKGRFMWEEKSECLRIATQHQNK